MDTSLILAPPDWNVTTGCSIVSLATKVRVNMLLTTARVLAELLDAIATLFSVGSPFSNVTLLESLTVVTSIPVIPAKLVKAILKVTVPAVSLVSGV